MARQSILPILRPFIVIRLATFFLFSMLDMQQQTVEMILISWRKPFLWQSPPIRLKKGLNFWRGPFFFVFAIDLSEKMPEFLVKTFLF